MGWWLAHERSVQECDWVKRFDPRFWTVDFPRPMMASVVTTGPDSLRVDAVFYDKDALAGLIWWSEDRYDHPLLGYAADPDYRGCRLRFRWRSGGVRPLDAVHGPTLTIEGRDARASHAAGTSGCGTTPSARPRTRSFRLTSPTFAAASHPAASRSGRAMWTGCSSRWCRPTMTRRAGRWRRLPRAGSS